MKRSFVYFVFVLALSLLLCGCGNMSERGNVTASPWPDVTTPALPVPSAAVSGSPVPEFNGNNTDSTGNNVSGTNTPGTSTASPAPTDMNR